MTGAEMACYEDDQDGWDDDREDDHCDCIDAELDWQGEFHCASCGHTWDATAEQMERHWEWYDRAHRPPTLWERISDWLLGVKQRLAAPFRSRAEKTLDDDIPF